jgi:predicted Zn-dependent protease
MKRNHQLLIQSVSVFVAIGLVACATSPLGRKQLILMPNSQMEQMGAQAFSELKKNTPQETRAEVNTYVRCVSDRLLRQSESAIPAEKWEVLVFRDSSANAFALPGGKIGVHTGLLRVARTDAQLAAVIGHEIGHVLARHGSERVSENLVAQLGLQATASILGEKNSARRGLLLAALGVGAQVGVLLPHSRTQESEADWIGLRLMAKAGYDPKESAQLWRNMLKEGGGAPPEFLSTHPASERRIEDLDARIPDALPLYEKARSESSASKCVRPSGLD